MNRKVAQIFMSSEVTRDDARMERIAFDIAGDGDKWEEYEQGKKEIQAQGLTPVEYERAINALCERLGI